MRLRPSPGPLAVATAIVLACALELADVAPVARIPVGLALFLAPGLLWSWAVGPREVARWERAALAVPLAATSAIGCALLIDVVAGVGRNAVAVAAGVVSLAGLAVGLALRPPAEASDRPGTARRPAPWARLRQLGSPGRLGRPGPTAVAAVVLAGLLLVAALLVTASSMSHQHPSTTPAGLAAGRTPTAAGRP